MKTFPVVLASMAALILGVLAFARPALPAPASPPPIPAPTPQGSPTITWSVSQLTQTMFPGTTSTVTLSFQSDQNLTGIAVDITPSLRGVVSASPVNIASVTANQPYQLAFTLVAPTAFIKRSFGGTIHVRNANGPPLTYAEPLTVDLQTNWGILTDSNAGFTLFYPLTLYNLTEANSPPDLFDLESSPMGVTLGGAVPAGSLVATSGFAITIHATPYNSSSPFDVTQYLSTKFLDLAADASITPLMIGGQQGYGITFQGEEGGNLPLCVVYHGGFVYELKYSSTDYIDGFSDLEGLKAFNVILQHFTFSR
jgi:hypothetical protein